jgi:hypothetical protein
VDAVGPNVDVALVLERAAAPLLLLLDPGLLEPNDGRRRQAGSLRADQVLQVLREVAGGDALEVEPGDQLVDRLRPSKVRRQNLARETEALAILVNSSIIDARLLDVDHTDSGLDLARLAVAVSHNQPATVLVSLVGMIVDVCGNLRLDRLRQHLLGSLFKDLCQGVFGRGAWTWDDFVRSVAHVAYRPSSGLLVVVDNHQGTPRSHIAIHNFWSYLHELANLVHHE